MGVQGTAKDIVMGVSRHHSLGQVCLAVEDCAGGQEERNEGAIGSSRGSGEEGHIANGRLCAFDVERVLTGQQDASTAMDYTRLDICGVFLYLE